MKISREKFNYLKDNKKLSWRLIELKKDRYLFLFSFKRIFINIYNVVECIFRLPIGLVLAILNAVWECILDLPEYFKELWYRILDLSPIKYIKVVDEELSESIK